jgi:uncharacterized protein
MKGDDFRLLIENGDVAGVRRALDAEPALSNRAIHWVLNQPNESDPLHYVSDCVFNGWLTNGTEGEIALALLAHGAAVDGSAPKETPLIGAVSLGAEKVARVLLEHGADVEPTSVYGARALHWAAWMGLPSSVELLVARGADIEARCSQFGATPLFWAVHGYGPNGPAQKRGQVEAARILLTAGARADTANKEGLSAVELSRRCAKPDLYELLQAAGARH